MIPAARIMGTGSDPVSAVTAKTAALTAQSRQSRRSVSLRSLYPAMVMIAMTAGAIP